MFRLILKLYKKCVLHRNLENGPRKKGEITFYNLDGDEIQKELKTVEWDAEAAEKAGFEHFMMKEIHEQPKAVQDTLNSVIKNGTIDLTSVEITEDEIKNFEQIISLPAVPHGTLVWQHSMCWKIWQIFRCA